MKLELKNIKKSYGKTEVLSNISVSLEEGIHGFLGANGVGKSTLFHILTGYISSYEGKIIFPEYKKDTEILIGTLPQRFCGYPEMTVQEFMNYMGNIKIRGIDKKILNQDINEKLELFDLQNLKKKKIRKLSGGQLRRLGIAQAFQLNPKIVLLDEPTTGLDPAERVRFKNYIADAGQKQIILLSTHIVSDLEYIAKRIYILKNGHFVASGTEEQLISKCDMSVWEMGFRSESELKSRLNMDQISMIYEKNRKIRARFISEKRPSEQAISVEPNLNDVYLSFFKESQGK